MYLSAVLDPSVFNKYTIKKDDYINNVQAFIEDILDFGVLFFDKEHRLHSEIKNRIKYLTPRAQAIWGEFLSRIMKEKSRKVIEVGLSEDLIMGIAYCLAVKFRPDIFLLGNASYPSICGIDIFSYQFCDMRREIKYEKHKAMCSCWQFEDGADVNILDEIICRSVRFSDSVDIYDSFIGKSIKYEHYYGGSSEDDNPLLSFHKGIRHVLELWEKSSIFEEEKIFNLHTVFFEKRKNDNRKNGKYLTANEVSLVIRNNLIERLRSEFKNIKIGCIIYSDPFGEAHPRIMETKYSVLNFEKGFDFYYKSRDKYILKANEISRRPSSYKIRHSSKDIVARF